MAPLAVGGRRRAAARARKGGLWIRGGLPRTALCRAAGLGIAPRARSPVRDHVLRATPRDGVLRLKGRDGASRCPSDRRPSDPFAWRQRNEARDATPRDGGDAEPDLSRGSSGVGHRHRRDQAAATLRQMLTISRGGSRGGLPSGSRNRHVYSTSSPCLLTFVVISMASVWTTTTAADDRGVGGWRR